MLVFDLLLTTSTIEHFLLWVGGGDVLEDSHTNLIDGDGSGPMFEIFYLVCSVASY